MRNSWREMDFAGGGLQAANIRLTRQLKKPRVAYGLLLLFPLGLHRLYLRDRRGLYLYASASLVGIFLLFASQPISALAVGALMATAAAADALWIARRLPAVNKQIRMAVYFGQGATPPPGYRGRTAAPEQGASNNEQEGPSGKNARRQDSCPIR
jgi:hypothetical protein